MPIIRNLVRFAAVSFSGLFIALGIVGVLGVWLVERRAAEIATNAYGLVESAVGVVDGGVARVNDHISTSRTEVRQAAETIANVGIRPDANRPVLRALSERLEKGLAPRIAQIHQVLSPVRDAVGIIGNTINLLNSVPTMADRSPRLAALDEAIKRLEDLSLDTTQLRSTLRELAEAQTSDLSDETITTIKGLTERIDSRLGQVQANVQGVQDEIAALQHRMNARKSRLLLTFNVMAIVATLMLAWILYSQAVVIRYHRCGTLS